MNERTKGLSTREIAKRWGVSQPYVVKFLQQAGINQVAGGGYDIAVATAARNHYTRPGVGVDRYRRSQTRTVLRTCRQCGGRYTTPDSTRKPYARDSASFCTAECEQESLAGTSSRASRERIWKQHLACGGSPRDKGHPEIWLDWSRP